MNVRHVFCCFLSSRYFMIVSEANCSVLEMDDASGHPGCRLVLNKRRPDRQARQLWYLDHENVIRTKLSDCALQCRGGSTAFCFQF